jgi:hypothetical protein
MIAFQVERFLTHKISNFQFELTHTIIIRNSNPIINYIHYVKLNQKIEFLSSKSSQLKRNHFSMRARAQKLMI